MQYDTNAIVALGFMASILVISVGLVVFIMTRKNKN